MHESCLCPLSPIQSSELTFSDVLSFLFVSVVQVYPRSAPRPKSHGIYYLKSINEHSNTLGRSHKNPTVRELCDKCYVAYSFEQTDTNCKAFCETLVTWYVWMTSPVMWCFFVNYVLLCLLQTLLNVRTDSKIAMVTHPVSMCQEAFIVIVKKDLLEEESTVKVRTTKKTTNLNYIW